MTTPTLFIDKSYFQQTCYFSCTTKDGGESYVCKEFSDLNKAIKADPDASILPKNCACPKFAQFLRLTRNLGTNKVTIL